MAGTASWLVAGARLRRYIKWVVALGLLMAGAGGMIVAVVDGAGRASSAFTRLLVATKAPDGYVFLTDDTGALEPKVEQLPQVVQAGHALVLGPGTADYSAVVLTDPRFGTQINGFKYLSGRRPLRSDEAMISFTQARSEHLHTGSELNLAVPGSTATTALVRVVGVVADTRTFPPLPYADEQAVYLDASFLRTPAAQVWVRASGRAQMVAVRLRGGVPAFPSFLHAVEQINGGPVGSDTRDSEAAGAVRSMHLQSLALWMTAGFGALVVLAVLSQLLLRQLADHRAAAPALHALGLTTGQLILADVIWIGATTVVAAVGAVLVAWAASPLFPLGTARVANPHPGFTFDWRVVVPSAAVFVAAILVVGAASSWRLQRSRPDAGAGVEAAGRPFAAWLQKLPAVMATGIRLALRSGRGRAAVPARTTIGANAVAIGGVVVAMTFAASLGHLLSTPRLYGTTYDADIEMNANFGDVRAVVPSLMSDPDITDIAVADTGIPLRSGPVSFGAEAITDVKGSILPTVVEGRLPDQPDEIVLGSQTMASLHTAIGRTIQVAVTGITSPVPVKVVGRGVLAPLADSETLGKGAILDSAALGRFLTKAPAGFPAPGPGDAFVRFKPGISPTREIPALTVRLGGIQKVIVTAPTQPTDVADFGQVRSLPQVLAGLLASLAAATMAYLLISATRRRRRELAILKTIGFVPSQISAAVAWQATTIAAVAMLVGIPLGIIAGRAVWSTVAHQMGVVVETQVPWILVALLVPAAVVVANLLAAGPAAAGGRISATRALRGE